MADDPRRENGSLSVEILGSLRVLDARGEVAIAGGKERALLGLLLLDHGQVVGMDRIVQELWGDTPPTHPVSAVRVLASRLRRSLGPSGFAERLRTVPPGYVVALEPDELDAARFAAQARSGASSLARGDARQAAEELRRALSLWRGDVLADVELGETSQAAISRLREERLATLELRIEADIACGRHGAVVDELEDLVRSFPLREGLWHKLIVALSRTSRAPEARQRAADLRAVMADVGLEPSPSFAELEASLSVPAASGAVRPSLPEAVSERRTSLVGRRGEVDRLLAIYEEVAGGSSATVLVSGEPGVGKTSLVAEVAAMLHDRGATVLYGQCDEDLQIPHQPFREALQSHLRSLSAEDVQSLLTTWPQLRPLAGLYGRSLVAPPAGGDAEGERERLFDEVERWLRDLASGAPVVVIIDDLHWASSATVQLLRRLSQQRWYPLLFAITFRDTEGSEPVGLREMLESVHRQPNTHRVQLTGLDREGVAELLRSHGGALVERADPGFAARIHEETAGNPFFATELVRHLTEVGRPGGSRVKQQLRLPDGVTDVIRRRLDRLSPATNQVLRLAATIGPVIPFTLMSAAATSTGSTTLLDALDEATASGLLVETGDADFTFAHALVRKTIYPSMSVARRVRLHRSVGEGLLRLPSPLPNHTAALAHHFCLGATLGDGVRAARYAMEAGVEALDQAAQEGAKDYFERGLAVLERYGPPDLRLEADLLLGLAQACARSNDHYGRLEAAEKAADLARAAGCKWRLAEAAYWMCRFGIVGALRPDMVALCEEALERLGDDESPVRARLTAAFAGIRAISGEGLAADPLAAEAVHLARGTGDPEILGAALDARVMTLSGGPDISTRLAVAEEMVAVARRDHARIALGNGYQYRGVARLTIGDRPGFERDFSALRDIGEEMRDGYLRAVSAQWTAMLALLDGRFDQVEAPAGEAPVLSGGPNFANATAAQMFWLQHELGNHEAVLPLLEAVVAENPGIAGFRAALAMSHALSGHRQEAARELTAILAGDPTPVPHDWIRTATLTLCAETAAFLEDTEAARHVERLLRPFAGQLVVVAIGTHCQGAVDRFLGMLAATSRDWTRARKYLREAVALEERAGSPPNVARSQLWYAHALRGDGADEEARELAEECQATAERLGMAALATDAAAARRGERRWAAS
ncbi:MAG: BTAD domain-containing putative transcriptional regulator [Acidimicrobiales bacterium]